MWVIVAEDGSGSDFRYSVRFVFQAEADCKAAHAKLANISAAAYNLVSLSNNRRAPQAVHEARLAAALEVLQEMDPDGSATTVYRMQEVTGVWAEPSSAPPVSTLQALFRGIRDLAE